MIVGIITLLILVLIIKYLLRVPEDVCSYCGSTNLWVEHGDISHWYLRCGDCWKIQEVKDDN